VDLEHSIMSSSIICILRQILRLVKSTTMKLGEHTAYTCEAGCCEQGNEHLGFIKVGNFDWLNDY
jgi:hypothetical protein